MNVMGAAGPGPQATVEGRPAALRRVPFLDVAAANAEVGQALQTAIGRVVESGRFILGPEGEAFESDWAAFVGTIGCVGVGNGLDALTLSLRAMGVGPGDEVIVPGQTFVATWLAVTAAGGRPVPVDVDSRTANLNPALLEAAITSRTRVVVAVHLFGRVADMDAIGAVARRHGLLVLEDAAQAHGARVGERRAGSIGDAAAWSFYPSKNLGAMGDAGAITSDDRDFLDRVRLLRNYGSTIRYRHETLGVNSRLDELQAAVLRAKLPYLETWNERRRRVARTYLDELSDLPDLQLPEPPRDGEHVWHLFVVRHPRRERLRQALEAAGIETLIHYPVAPHQQPAFAGAVSEGTCLPESEALAAEALSLPMGPHLNDEQVGRVVDSIRKALR